MKRAGAQGRKKIATYAADRARELMRKLAKEVERSRKHGDADAIHDLRVSVRRLAQCLDVFGGLFPDESAKRLRKRIRKIRRLAGEVRDRDITIEKLSGLDIPAPDGFAERMRKERADAYDVLAAKLEGLSRKKRIAAWARDLGLERK